jgi:hypothetical protein
MEHVYTGTRGKSGAVVFKDDRPFDHRPSRAYRNHSPTGFEWSYQGSGPAQLALALLLEVTDSDTALDLYQDYKREVVACWPIAGFTVTTADLRAWLAVRKETATARA